MVLNRILSILRKEKPLAQNAIIDSIVVWKSRRIMQVYQGNKLLKTYAISLGKRPIGPKVQEGDLRTPEGIYAINGRNPQSRFYRNLGISYPNQSDSENAAKLGKPPGGDIKIHGLRNGRGYRGKLHLLKDWTAGCIAVTNRQMDEIYQTVTPNALITIYP